MADDTCTNPLFLGWIKEWWDIERERNSKGAPTYKRAYNSLKSCPLIFQHPSELDVLSGIGPKICQRLTDKLKRHCEENGLPMPKHPKGSKRKRELENALAEAAVAQNEQPSPPKKARTARTYVPKLNSGAYALLMALSDPGPSGYMDKTALIAKAQPYSEYSFTVPSMANRSYTAWDSMKYLDKKELVHIRGRPTKRYSLTDEGWQVVKRMKEARDLVDGVGGNATASRTATASGSGTSNVNRNDENINPNRPDSGVKRESRYTPLDLKPFGSATVSPEKLPQPKPRTATSESIVILDSDEEDFRYDEVEDRKPIIRETTNREYIDLVADGDAVPADESSLPHFTPIRLAPGSFTVELVLDTREVQAKNNRDHIQEELCKLGVRPIMRSLELGDVLWIAKCKQPGWLNRLGAEGDEVVLDYIVERKRLDDLIGSIKDGRFREQKYRLKRSGMKKVIYVIESFNLDQDIRNKYHEAMDTAMASIQVVNGYFLKKTDTIAESIKYLAAVTYMLKEIYEAKPLFVIPTKVLTAKNYLPLIKHLREKEPSRGHYISYPAFASLVSKSEMMTLGDVFLKMLMCIRRLSGEKAIEIRKVWKTPYELVKAFEACGTDENGKKKQRALVASMLSHLVDRRSVDNGLSEKIAEVWGFL
ncbi:ERCC4 domain-containing protein [Pseudoneurospora amorphoporcata]|uniref:Crossover junction endonuclease MUS81 n=1 Tax=Pseudoneurospora amorphoporcata TaxID=241081 RepID=A0AAN6NNT7_9PEZI|nr:ERCC4 domain-containing protein [Pseudoneurospora amorphoporcata]